jgi:hypothetical protein
MHTSTLPSNLATVARWSSRWGHISPNTLCGAQLNMVARKLDKTGHLKHHCGLVNTESKANKLKNALQLTQSMATIQWWFASWGPKKGNNNNNVYAVSCVSYLGGRHTAEAAHTTGTCTDPLALQSKRKVAHDGCVWTRPPSFSMFNRAAGIARDIV